MHGGKEEDSIGVMMPSVQMDTKRLLTLLGIVLALLVSKWVKPKPKGAQRCGNVCVHLNKCKTYNKNYRKPKSCKERCHYTCVYKGVCFGPSFLILCQNRANKSGIQGLLGMQNKIVPSFSLKISLIGKGHQYFWALFWIF